MALKYHPDKAVGGPSAKMLAGEIFKLVGHAYDKLSDDTTLAQYTGTRFHYGYEAGTFMTGGRKTKRKRRRRRRYRKKYKTKRQRAR